MRAVFVRAAFRPAGEYELREDGAMPPDHLKIVTSRVPERVDKCENDQKATLAKKLAEIFADIQSMENPFTPPDRTPPRGAPGQRIPRRYDDPAEEAEAAERQVA